MNWGGGSKHSPWWIIIKSDNILTSSFYCPIYLFIFINFTKYSFFLKYNLKWESRINSRQKTLSKTIFKQNGGWTPHPHPHPQILTLDLRSKRQTQEGAQVATQVSLLQVVCLGAERFVITLEITLPFLSYFTHTHTPSVSDCVCVLNTPTHNINSGWIFRPFVI